MKYSDAFNNLHKLSIDADVAIESFDARKPIELVSRNIASLLGILMTAEYRSETRLGILQVKMQKLRCDSLKCLGGLTRDEWDDIRWTMLGNISILNSSGDFKNRRIDWIRDLETIYAFGDSCENS